QGPRLVLGFAFGREPAHDKLLCQGGEHALGGVDNDSLERLPRAAIRCRVEVARILVQKGWQDGTADHDGAYAVGSASAIALTVGSPTLAVVGNVRCL